MTSLMAKRESKLSMSQFCKLRLGFSLGFSHGVIGFTACGPVSNFKERNL